MGAPGDDQGNQNQLFHLPSNFKMMKIIIWSRMITGIREREGNIEREREREEERERKTEKEWQRYWERHRDRERQKGIEIYVQIERYKDKKYR